MIYLYVVYAKKSDLVESGNLAQDGIHSAIFLKTLSKLSKGF